MSMRAKVKLIQDYITSLEYNYTGQEFFIKKKDRGFRHVTSTAKLIIRESLPIQCVEAVYLGAFLTANMYDVDRFPVCFRSCLDGRIFRHIVLAVRSGVMWGALGLSRRATLMYKELRYSSFSKLIADFRESYAGSWHRLENVWVGFPLPHDISSNVPVKWKVMRTSVETDAKWDSAARDLDRFVACAPAMFESFVSTLKVPNHPLLRGSNISNVGGGKEGDPGTALREDGDGSRESPGAESLSAGSRRPLLWLGPGMAVRHRRASTAIGRSFSMRNGCVGGKGNRMEREALDKIDIKYGVHCAIGTGSCYSGLFVSPPRARARSTGVGLGGRSSSKGRRSVVNGKSSADDKEALSKVTDRKLST